MSDMEFIMILAVLIAIFVYCIMIWKDLGEIKEKTVRQLKIQNEIEIAKIRNLVEDENKFLRSDRYNTKIWNDLNKIEELNKLVPPRNLN